MPDTDMGDTGTSSHAATRQHTLAIIVILAFILILTLSIWLLSRAFTPQQDTIRYGLYTFTPGRDGFYHLTYQHPMTQRLYDIPLRYLPQNLTSIPVTGSLSSLPEPIIIAVDINTTANEDLAYMQLAAADLARKLKNLYNPTLQSACTPSSSTQTVCENHTIYTCTGNTSGIAFHLAAEPRVELKGICANIYGQGKDLVKAEERFVYTLLGIMKP